MAYAVTANGYGIVGQLTTGDAYLALATSNKTGVPTFSPKPGKYQGSVTVTLNHTSPNASIYYTTDGAAPTVNSTPYTAPILVTATTTIKAIAIVPGYPQRAVTTGKYTIK
jgi:Chitobiase/beta-hexosaminidase C-terminal domain